MVIKMRLIELDITKNNRKKIVKYLETNFNKIYYIDGFDNESFKIKDVVNINDNIEFCKNIYDEPIVRYKQDKYMISSKFLKDNHIIEDIMNRR